MRLKSYGRHATTCDIQVRGPCLALLSAGPTLSGLGKADITRGIDAVREGLRLPPLDWPSGRVRPLPTAAVPRNDPPPGQPPPPA